MQEQAVTIGRRALLGGAAALLAAPRLRAQVPAIPEVDTLSVQFLVDGAVSSFAEPIRTPDLVVERARRDLEHVERRLLAEWGLSLLLQSRRGGETRGALLDFGYSPQAIVNNVAVLETDLSGVEALLLSHGHYDHFGGLKGLLRSGKLRPRLPLYVGGEEALCHRLRRAEPPLDFGELNRGELRNVGIELRIAPEPVTLAGHGLTTGQIPLAVEQPKTPSFMQPGKNCDRAALDPDKRKLDIVQDDSRHELGLAYHVRGKGLVVLGSCSHRGILNTIRRAQQVTGVTKVHAVLGGFHLVAPQTREDAARTAHAMAALAPDYVVPGHCSGEWFIEAASAAMPGKVIRPYVGSRFIFGVQA